MSIVLEVNSTDVSSQVDWRSLVWEQALTHEVDTVTFSVKKFGSKTFSPEVLDDVKLYDNGTLVFGGVIVDIKEEVIALGSIEYQVTAKDYAHIADKFLVQETYQNVPLINVITDIFNKYVNKKWRIEIADFENNEVWEGDGSYSTAQFRDGEQSLLLTCPASTTQTATRELFLDLTQKGLTTDDIHELDVYVDNVDNLDSLTLKLGGVGLGSHYALDITSQIVRNGWNLVRIASSAATSTGSPNWASIDYQEIEAVANSSGEVNVYVDNWGFISASEGFTRENAYNAEQVIESIQFNLEEVSTCLRRLAERFALNWYFDENRDLHFFGQFEEVAPFDLTDDNEKYIYKSLIFNRNADQLRNSVFVRGGTYLDTERTEDLSVQVDGTADTFKVGYKYDLDSMEVEVNSVEVSVGKDNVDNYVDTLGAAQSLYGLTELKVGDVTGRQALPFQIIFNRKGRMEKIKLRVKKDGAPADNFTVRAYADNGSNQPDYGTPLSALATYPGASLTTDFVEITLSLTETATNDLLKNKDTKIFINISRSGAVDNSNYYLIDAYADVYDGRELYYTGATFTSVGYSPYFVQVLGFEALYNESEKNLVFETAPSVSASVQLTGKPKKKILIHHRDNTSINEYGEFQFKVEDLSLDKIEAARQRALEEIYLWANEVNEATYLTYESGLRVGDTQNVQSDLRGLDVDCIINKVSATARTPDSLEYSVSLVTTKTMGIIYWLQQQILSGRREVTQDNTELLDKIEGVSEEITLSDSLSTTLYEGKVWSNDAGTTPDHLEWSGGAGHIWL